MTHSILHAVGSIHLAVLIYGDMEIWRWALLSPDGVAPNWMVSVSASVNLLLHHKVQKFSSGTGSPGWSRKKGRKTVVVVWCWTMQRSHQTLQWMVPQLTGHVKDISTSHKGTHIPMHWCSTSTDCLTTQPSLTLLQFFLSICTIHSFVLQTADSLVSFYIHNIFRFLTNLHFWSYTKLGLVPHKYTSDIIEAGF